MAWHFNTQFFCIVLEDRKVLKKTGSSGSMCSQFNVVTLKKGRARSLAMVLAIGKAMTRGAMNRGQNARYPNSST